MQFDLGVRGLVALISLSLIFGGLAQVVLGRGTTRWMWLIGTAAWFVGGLIASEVVWGTATEQELQPNVDGLSLDESLLGGLVVGVPVVLVTWYVARRRNRLHQQAPPA